MGQGAMSQDPARYLICNAEGLLLFGTSMGFSACLASSVRDLLSCPWSTSKGHKHMNLACILLIGLSLAMSASVGVAANDPSPSAATSAVPAASQPVPPPVPPPAAPAKLGAAELEKLVAPIALYPDPLLSVLLPASAYPLEIVQAARFVKDSNNVAQLDQQPWDVNVKAVARFPSVIQKMDADLSWTMDLGRAFMDQQTDVMNAIQTLRARAQAVGTLKDNEQQKVVVNSAVVEKTVQQQIIYVTNTVVQIQPANPQVIYVPQYNPTVVYAAPPPDPMASLLTFGAGIAVGALIANNCDWHGGCVYVWHGGWGPPPPPPPPPHPPGPPGPHPPSPNPPGPHPPGPSPSPDHHSSGVSPSGGQSPGTTGAGGTGQRWQPDPNHKQSFAPSSSASSARTFDARGWGSGGGSNATRPATPSSFDRHSTAETGFTRPATSSQSYTRSSSTSGYSHESAFGGMGNGAATHDYSNRGSSSRGGSYSGGTHGGGGGGFRGGRR